jgi:hypothetical protein
MKMSEEKKEDVKAWNILYANADILIAVPKKEEEE